MIAFDVKNLADLKAWAVDRGMIGADHQVTPGEWVWLHNEWQTTVFLEVEHWCKEPEAVSIG